MTWSLGCWNLLRLLETKTAAVPVGKIATQRKRRSNKKDF